MSNGSEIVVSNDLTEIRALSKELALSQLLPQALRQKPADVLAVTLAGKELGLQPMQSIRGLDVISGKIAMNSGLIGALIMSSPKCEYLTILESTDQIATYETKRKGSPAPVKMSFTFKEAEQAGLASKDNYKKNPTAQLLARAVSRIGRAVYPDVCMGLYAEGELDDAREVNDPPASSVGATREKLKAARPTDVIEGEVVADPPGSVGRALKPSEETQPAEVTKFEKPAPLPVGEFTRVGQMQAAIKATKTADDLKALIPQLKTFNAEDAKLLRPTFDARKAELVAR